LGRGARKLQGGGRERGREEEVTVTATETIRKEIFVDAAPETAFRVFTDKVSAWWPLDKYAIYLEEAETVAFEDRDGWRLIERAKDGRENVWGAVLEYERESREQH